jgi:8-oxo-dGTP diphosphatase
MAWEHQDMPLIVVRHARAGRRSAWTGEDAVRPLSARGQAQAAALIPLLSGLHPRRILSSPAVRCMQTMAPLADALGLPVEPIDSLGEGQGTIALGLVVRMVGEPAILCTHRDVATELLEALTPGATAKARYRLRLGKGDAWVLGSRNGRPVITEHLRPEPSP